jgi:hypothetical protein
MKKIELYSSDKKSDKDYIGTMEIVSKGDLDHEHHIINFLRFSLKGIFNKIDITTSYNDVEEFFEDLTGTTETSQIGYFKSVDGIFNLVLENVYGRCCKFRITVCALEFADHPIRVYDNYVYGYNIIDVK